MNEPLSNATIAINTTILKYQMLKPVLCLFSTVTNPLILCFFFLIHTRSTTLCGLMRVSNFYIINVPYIKRL